MTRWWLALVPAVALCAACASAVNGAASPDSSEPRLPSRPQILNIQGIDPCSTLTGAQLKSLGVARYGSRTPDGTRGPSCDWIHSSTEPVENYSLDINTLRGVEVVLDRPQLQVVTVAGFGAVQSPAPHGNGQDCVVNVDVAPSQAVQVAYFYNGTTIPMTHEIACQKARRAAELAMQTILARTG